MQLSRTSRLVVAILLSIPLLAVSVSLFVTAFQPEAQSTPATYLGIASITAIMAIALIADSFRAPYNAISTTGDSAALPPQNAPTPQELAEFERNGQVTQLPFDALWTYILIAVNVGMILLTTMTPELLTIGANNRLMVLELGNYYRLVTALFLHSDFGHLFFNMLALYQAGKAIEHNTGHGRFLAIYFVGGLCGSLAGIVFNTPETYSIGASGAVFGLFSALLVLEIRQSGIGSVWANLSGLIITMILNLLYGFSIPGIDIWAHLGGIVGGIVSALVFTQFFRRVWQPSSVLIEINPRATRNLVFISLALPVLLFFTLFQRNPVATVVPRTFDLEGMTLEIPALWITTDFAGEAICQETGVKCLLTGEISTETQFEIMQFAGFVSRDEIVAQAETDFKSQGGRLISDEILEIDERVGIKLVGELEGSRLLAVFIREGLSLYRIRFMTSESGYEAQLPVIESILASIRFES